MQRMVLADADVDCVRTRFGYKRLQWAMDDHASTPSLAVVEEADVLLLEQVELDFVPLTEKDGLFAKPESPTTGDEWRRRRFFVNPLHTWTSAPVNDL